MSDTVQARRDQLAILACSVPFVLSGEAEG